MKLLRSIALLTLISAGGSNSAVMAIKPTASQQRDLVARAAKLKHNGALHYLIKKAAAKKTQTKARQEKCHTDLDRKKMLYAVVFACLICNTPSILAHIASSIESSTHDSACDDHHSAQPIVKYAGTPNIVPTTNSFDLSHASPQLLWTSSDLLNGTQDIDFNPIADNSATITHIRPNGLIQKCNIIDNEHVVCSLSNPNNGKTLHRDFKLQFDGVCRHSEVGPQDTQILRELKNAVVRNNTVSIPLTVENIQKLCTHTHANAFGTGLNKKWADFAQFNFNTRQLILGNFLFNHPNMTMNDNDIIFFIAHEIGHATQTIIENSSIRTRLQIIHAFIISGVTSPLLLHHLSRLSQSKPTRTSIIKGIFYFCIACCAFYYAINGFTLTEQSINFILKDLSLGYAKWNLQFYRKFSAELNADLLSVLISEPLHHYWAAKHSILDGVIDYTFDPHPPSSIRCAYIQEFIQKYQELLTWFQSHQNLIQ